MLFLFFLPTFSIFARSNPGGGGGEGGDSAYERAGDFTAVKRVKFAKVKRNTSKLRLLLSLSKV